MGIVSELRRRNVFRMALLYLGAAWLIMQVVDLLIDRGPFPESIGPITLTVMAIGFPIALVISWFYELTPEGISLDTDREAARSATGFGGRRVDFVIISLLAAAVLVFSYDKWWTGPPPERSVAVLPFVNMSAGEETVYFSDGLADTLLHMLAQVPNLRVAARTSSFRFRGYERDIGEIGDALNVSAVLEGSVQLYDDKIRVTAQLIDATNGYHLWSQTIDRDFKDIFAIQDEIANEVVSALRLTLLDETVERLDLTRSENVEAYIEYLKGIDELNPPTTESYRRALAHMLEATRLDPEYAQAFSTLGLIYLRMARYGVIGGDEALAKAKDAASRALDIAPESSQALAVLGAIELRQDNDDAARLLLDKAIEKDPNNVFALRYYGDWLNAQGRNTEAEDVYRRIVVLDPLDDVSYAVLFTFLRVKKSTSEALEIIPKWRKALPDSPNIAYNEAILYSTQGKYAEAVRASLTLPAADPNDPDGPVFIGRLYLSMNMPDEARQWFDRAVEMNPEHPLSLAAPLWLNFYQQQNEEDNVRLARELLANGIRNWKGARPIAITVLMEHAARSGQYRELLERLDNLYPHLFDDPPYDLQKDWLGTIAVGLTLVYSGDIDRGGPLLRANMELDEKWVHPPLESAMVRLALGEKEAAMRKFRGFASGDWKWGEREQTLLKHSFIFDPIRDEPEFIALLDEYDRNAAEQRRLLKAMGIH